jgi:cell division inhibitor SepF
MGNFVDYIQGSTSKTGSKPAKRKEIGVICPEKFSDVEVLVNRLRNKEGLIVDFENIPPELAQRMLDFLSGGVYALSGTVRKLKYRMYILIPQGVKISTVRKE